jgi:hypothetical protein
VRSVTTNCSRPGVPSDWNKRRRYSNTDADSNGDPNRNPNSNGDCYACSYGDADGYTDDYAKAHAHAKTRTDAKAPSFTSTQTVGCAFRRAMCIYFTAGIADEERRLFDLTTEDEK